jgi:hypothetical protein
MASFGKAYLSGPIAYNRLISGSFHPPPGVLFSVPSQYGFAIGLGLYLVLEVASSHLPTTKLSRGTLGTATPTSTSPTGPSPSLVSPSRPLRLLPAGRCTAAPPYISHGFRHRIRFELSPFGSPLLRRSLMVSPPSPIEMFPFGEFPSLDRDARSFLLRTGSPIGASPDQRLHAPTWGISSFATPFFSTQAKPSIRRCSSRKPYYCALIEATSVSPDVAPQAQP